MSIVTTLRVADGVRAHVLGRPRLAGQFDDATTVVRWNEALLQAVRDARMPPPQVARASRPHINVRRLGCVPDARAVGTRLGHQLRRPRWERTPSNKIEAVSFAAHRALIDLFPTRRADLFDPLLVDWVGFPGKKGWGPSDPAGGRALRLDAVIAFGHHDGSNQLGDLTLAGTPYADYTGYVPVNDPVALMDPSRWQPMLLADGQSQRFLTPHWRQVTPFALTSASQFRPPAPARYGSAAYVAQSLPVIFMSGTLSDHTKAIATYWADGPSTETPPGHWMLFAQAVSTRDRHSLDDDVKMFFALAGCPARREHCRVGCQGCLRLQCGRERAIRFLFAGQLIPFLGRTGHEEPSSSTAPRWRVVHSDASVCRVRFRPQHLQRRGGRRSYSARRERGSMRMRATVAAGSFPIEPGFAPSEDVTLAWKTFSEAADQAGLSRRLGGIHFRDGDMESGHIGRRLGAQAWKKATASLPRHGAAMSLQAMRKSTRERECRKEGDCL